jgi:regulator of protease activity HflC (stomatin/prohibitin superfamily)
MQSLLRKVLSIFLSTLNPEGLHASFDDASQPLTQRTKTMTDTKNKFFHTQVTVPEGERALVLVNGVITDVLRPGRHKVMSFNRQVKVETNALSNRVFTSGFAEALTTSHAALAAEHLVTVQTKPGEVAAITRDGQFHALVKPDVKMHVWKDAGPWTVEVLDVADTVEVPKHLVNRLNTVAAQQLVKRFNVEDGQIGLLHVDGAFIRTLQPGVHVFWNVVKAASVKIVDVREHALDVTGQEILTRDKVSLRVNLAAKYRVVDAVKAHTSVKDFTDALYRSLQHAFRQSLATKSLDEILTRKGEVDGEAARVVRVEMEKIGLDVGDIAIKDVILPGDMRDILNKVVAAEKEAEAQVIRRREETNATRSLLNTAKVMAENPVMMRLKELEALEKIADKVQTLTVHNGTRGLLDDIVTLGTPTVATTKRK